MAAICATASASPTSGARASCVGTSCRLASATKRSRYTRSVAPRCPSPTTGRPPASRLRAGHARPDAPSASHRPGRYRQNHRRPRSQAAAVRSRQLRQAGTQLIHQAIGFCRLDPLVIVAGVDIAPEALPVLANDHVGRQVAHGQDVQPVQHGPQTILLAHVIGAGPRALLAAQGGHAGIEQGAEVLPASRRFVTGNSQRPATRSTAQLVGIERATPASPAA
jgi:hypothetical protein